MKILVTGAGGFLGSAVVRAAAAGGHEVLAMHRPGSMPDSSALPSGAKPLAGDLRQNGPWCDALADVDAVIHCAAAFGDLPSQLAGTVLGTENLLSALPPKTRRIVHISSFSVYDFDAPSWQGRLDEDTPLEPDALRRDAYTQTKLVQEKMVRSHAATAGIDLVVLRPGAIYGPGKDWGCGKAASAGPFDLIFAPFSAMRLIHVENCADAAVAALDAPVHGEVILNLVDREQPGHSRFHHMMRRAGVTSRIGLPVPYWCVRTLGLSARIASLLFFGGKAKLPEMLDLPRQKVRWRPLRYPGDRARQMLGYDQQISLQKGIETVAHANSIAHAKATGGRER